MHEIRIFLAAWAATNLYLFWTLINLGHIGAAIAVLLLTPVKLP